MLLQLIFFLVFILLLFFLSRKIHTAIYTTVYLFSGNQKIALTVLLLTLFPGTIIHELSHFLAATILHVPTGELSIFPSIEKSGEVRAGKLMIGRVDPFRQTFVGLAPVFIGFVIIYSVGIIFFPQPTTYNLPARIATPVSNAEQSSAGWQSVAGGQLTTILGFYILFITSITMFSSKKDVESLMIVGPIAFLVIAALYRVGVRIMLDDPLIATTALILQKINTSLLITTLLDGAMFTILFLIEKLGGKLLRRKVKP